MMKCGVHVLKHFGVSSFVEGYIKVQNPLLTKMLTCIVTYYDVGSTDWNSDNNFCWPMVFLSIKFRWSLVMLMRVAS